MTSKMGSHTFPFASYVPTNEPTFRSTKGRFCTMYQKQFAAPAVAVSGTSFPSSPNSPLSHEKTFPFKLTDRENEIAQEVPGAMRGERSSDGTIVVICGPSGVGKSTLIHKLLEDFPQRFSPSVSHTTRPPRNGEKPGVDYHFVGHEEFMQKREFVEKNEVHGHLYGTSVSAIQKVREEGKACILDIDVQGATCIRQSPLHKHALYVFIAPSSLQVLETRLIERNTETPESIARRMADAVAEMESQTKANFWDYVVVNDNFQRCYADLLDVLHLTLSRRAGGEPPENADTALLLRRGKVLGKNSLLYGKRPRDSTPHLRQVGSFIFGIEHPGNDGISWAIEEIKKKTPIELSSRSGDGITWVQLRHDPFVYINGRPFAVDRPGTNGETHWDRLLKIDIQEECRTYFGQILLHYEDGSYAWEPVYSVETEAEVFQKLAGHVRLVRLPLATLFSDSQVEQLRVVLRSSRSVIFSSTHGNARVTYAMAMATLFQQSPKAGSVDMPRIAAARKLAEIMSVPFDWVTEICEEVDDGFRELPPMGDTNLREPREKRALHRYLQLCQLGAYLWDQASKPNGEAFRFEYFQWVERNKQKLREVWNLAEA